VGGWDAQHSGASDPAAARARAPPHACARAPATPPHYRAVVAAATPPLWTTFRPRWLPWFLES